MDNTQFFQENLPRPMLVDPGKFYLKLIADLKQLSYSDSEILQLTSVILKDVLESTAPDDRVSITDLILSLKNYSTLMLKDEKS